MYILENQELNCSKICTANDEVINSDLNRAHLETEIVKNYFASYGMSSSQAFIFSYLFDKSFITQHKKDIITHKDLPGLITDYIEGRISLESPLFSDKEYFAVNSDVAAANCPALLHYSLWGAKENRTVNRLIPNADSSHFEIDNNLLYINNLECFDRSKWAPFIDIDHITNNMPLKTTKNKDILRSLMLGETSPCRLFSIPFYQKQCKLHGVVIDRPCILHYIHTGWKLGIDPSPFIDSSYYLVDQNTAENKQNDIDPLTYFLTNEDIDMLSPSPFLDLQLLRHNLCTYMDYEYETKRKMLFDLFEYEWVDFHKDVDRAAVSIIRNAHKLITERQIFASFNDFEEILESMRINSLMSKIKAENHSIPSKTNKPTVSIILLSYNKPILTLLSAFSIISSSHDFNTEILIPDNCSEPFNLELLYRHLPTSPTVKIIPIPKNKYFGEGNNIAIEQSTGDFVLFLNNDCFVADNTLKILIDALNSNESIGAVSPILLFNNLQIQEAGGTISDCGQVIQHLKHVHIEDYLTKNDNMKIAKIVDYTSAACCLVKKEVLNRVLGFDYQFEPFYYEDTDLCSRIKSKGYQIGIVPIAFAIHLENTSTKEYLNNDFFNMIQRQRSKFYNRWYGVFHNLGDETIRNSSPRFNTSEKYELIMSKLSDYGKSGKPIACVYTPFEINIGGGERYIISLAKSLTKDYEVWLLTRTRTSRTRLCMVMEDLNIDACPLNLATLNDIYNKVKPDLFICMGNEIEPSAPPIGIKNVYHCQFPFPVHHCGYFDFQNITGYTDIIVNSDFTKRNIVKNLNKYGITNKRIHVLHPPVSIPPIATQKTILSSKVDHFSNPTIVNIGRFSRSGHNKRQDIIISIARECIKNNLNYKFKIFGGLDTNTQNVEYYNNIIQSSNRTNTHIHPNAPRELIEKSLTEGFYYLHPCGYGYNEGIAPERTEHFGIAIIEAMSYGLIPIVYKWGAPSELFGESGVGYSFETLDDIMSHLQQSKSLSIDNYLSKMENCMKFSRKYSDSLFYKSVASLTMDI